MEDLDIWRTLPGLGGYYEISSTQRVRYKTDDGYFYLSTYQNKENQYIYVTFEKYLEKKKTCTIHQLIAQGFPEICGTWYKGCDVDHINGIRWDNRPENLRVCTHKENMNFELARQHASEALMGKMINRPDESKPVLQLDLEGNVIAEYPSLMEAERQTNVFSSNIHKVINGKRKKAGGFKWAYK